MSSPQQIRTPATDLLGIKHPVLLAGMNVAAGPRLAAAVTNAGGIGTIGGGKSNPLTGCPKSPTDCNAKSVTHLIC